MFQLKQLKSKIWHLHFESSYDLNLHFFRVQEFYESCNFGGRAGLKFIDLMEWYSKNNNGAFTYPTDWAGFNIPGEEIFRLAKEGIPDRNRYDDMIISIAEYIKSKENGMEDFYIIGTSQEDECLKETIRHELAHGLFFADDVYKEKSTELVNNLPGRARSFLYKKLKECGYGDKVLVDEAQAYLATGLYESFNTKALRSQMPEFEKLFKKHSKGILPKKM
jgi:hypothetical protein